MKLDERVARLEQGLRKAKARIAALEVRLREAGADAVDYPDWARALTAQERALVCALLDAHPRALSNESLDQLTPHHDHAAERCTTLIATVVSRARRKISGGIERVSGFGYRLSDSAALRLRPVTAAPAMPHSE